MMQPAIFNRLSANTVLVLKFLVLVFFVGTIVLPLSKVHAANFTCFKSTISSTTATLTIGETAAVYDIDTANFALAESSSNTSDLIASHSQNATSKAEQMEFEFEPLKPDTSYRVLALDGNNKFIEEMTSCNFKTKTATGAPSTVTNPGAAITTPPANNTTTTQTTTTNGSGNTIIPSTAQGLNVPDVSVGAGGSGLIPCDGPECDLNSVLQLMNNLMSFFFKTLLLPIFVVMVMYLGYSYLAAQGKPGQHAKLGSMAKHMLLGLLLMLCAWVIVRTILSLLGYHDDLFFFGK